MQSIAHPGEATLPRDGRFLVRMFAILGRNTAMRETIEIEGYGLQACTFNRLQSWTAFSRQGMVFSYGAAEVSKEDRTSAAKASRYRKPLRHG
jgi:hypothetical protein